MQLANVKQMLLTCQTRQNRERRERWMKRPDIRLASVGDIVAWKVLGKWIALASALTSHRCRMWLRLHRLAVPSSWESHLCWLHSIRIFIVGIKDQSVPVCVHDGPYEIWHIIAFMLDFISPTLGSAFFADCVWVLNWLSHYFFFSSRFFSFLALSGFVFVYVCVVVWLKLTFYWTDRTHMRECLHFNGFLPPQLVRQRNLNFN